MALLQPCFFRARWLLSEEEASQRDEPLKLTPDRLDALGPYVTGGTADRPSRQGRVVTSTLQCAGCRRREGSTE
uniref:Uncharacterized protein n=1 Tax=Oryza barthii TaxID=65489 RepID=A0A0D3GFQ2_9ORYZ